MFLLLIFCTGVGLILSVIGVYFRDVEYIWDVLTQLLFYMVPIVYPFQRITGHWTRMLIKINPLYSMIEMFRQSVLYGYMLSPKLLLMQRLYRLQRLQSECGYLIRRAMTLSFIFNIKIDKLKAREFLVPLFFILFLYRHSASCLTVKRQEISIIEIKI